MSKHLLGCLLASLLLGCASMREEQARLDWAADSITFHPTGEADALPITSASTLADYLALAVERNPGLQAGSDQWLASLERVPQARSLPDPQLMYGNFLESVETRVGPMRHKLGVTQMVPWPGKLIHREGIALEQADAARARYDARRLDLLFQVTQAYADYYYLGRDLAITEDTLALVQHWEAVAQTRLQAGARAAHRDVIKAQVEMGRLEDRLASLRDARRPHVEQLNALLDAPPGGELPWPRTLPAADLAVSDVEIVDLLERASPVLRELDKTLAARERGVDLAYQSYLPDLMLGLDWTEIGPARVRPFRRSGDDAWVARVGISLPIWFGRYGASVSEARARLRAAERSREDGQNRLEAAVSQALFAYRDAERKVRLYRDSLLPKAEQSLEAMASAYEADEEDFLNLLDAERLLLEFHRMHERARSDRLIALSRLEKLSGATLTANAEEPR